MSDRDVNPYAPPSLEADYEIGLTEAALDGHLATRWQRFSGYLVDTLLYVLAGASGGFIGGFWRHSAESPVAVFWVTILIPLSALGIVQWGMIARRGQSIGKRLLKTRIVRLDGSIPGFVYGVVLRSWIPIGLQSIPLVGSFIGLADALFVFRDDRRTIHDLIAGTKVIQVRK